MRKVLIITGPAGDAQGWGDLKVTQSVCDAINANGKSAQIAFVENLDDFKKAVKNNSYDIIWSALYHASSKADIIGLSANNEAWLADYLDAWQIPYIGPNALTMKQLIQKYDTHRILDDHGVSVPYHVLVDMGDPLPQVAFPAFVKPSTESRSVGISDDSVVNSPSDLQKQIDFVHTTFKQPALIEEYLPGEEYTVLMLGNGGNQEFLPGIVKVDASHYGKYPILRSDMRGVGLTKIYRPETRVEEAVDLCKQATDALNCWDHVRVDMRVDGSNRFKIIEVNGIPGLKPIKSWSPQIYTLYHASPQGPDQDYRNLIDAIVESGLTRNNLK
jgi:D-alanine-D-alanine ligase